MFLWKVPRPDQTRNTGVTQFWLPSPLKQSYLFKVSKAPCKLLWSKLEKKIVYPAVPFGCLTPQQLSFCFWIITINPTFITHYDSRENSQILVSFLLQLKTRFHVVSIQATVIFRADSIPMYSNLSSAFSGRTFGIKWEAPTKKEVSVVCFLFVYHLASKIRSPEMLSSLSTICWLVACLAYSSTLKTKAIGS